MDRGREHKIKIFFSFLNFKSWELMCPFDRFQILLQQPPATRNNMQQGV